MDDQAENSIERRKAGGVLRIIRNALAHGNVVYLNAEGYEQPNTEVRYRLGPGACGNGHLSVHDHATSLSGSSMLRSSHGLNHRAMRGYVLYLLRRGSAMSKLRNQSCSTARTITLAIDLDAIMELPGGLLMRPGASAL